MTFTMIDVGQKPITRRTAKARGEIVISPKVAQAIRDRQVPKGDVLALAEVAGIMAVKKTPEILPLCHPLAIDSVKVTHELASDPDRVVITSEVICHGKTGVEMEALHSVTAALLCIYDLTKALDKGAKIQDVSLLEKSGGRSGTWSANNEIDTLSPFTGISAAVIIASDSRSTGKNVDRTGPIISETLRSFGSEVLECRVVPDDVNELRHNVSDFTSPARNVHLLIISGGTGIGPRDVTPEALDGLWRKKLTGFGELFRSKGLLSTPYAWVSRADAGVVGDTLVVLLPGSVGAVRDGMEILKEHVPHLLRMMRGEGHD